MGCFASFFVLCCILICYTKLGLAGDIVFSIGFLYVTTPAWYENNIIKDAKEFLVFQSPNNMANDINKYNISTCISLKP